MNKEVMGIGAVPGKPGLVKVKRSLEKVDSCTVRCSPVAEGQCPTDDAVKNGVWLLEPAPGQEDLVTSHESLVRADEIIGDKVEEIEVGQYYFEDVRRPRFMPPPGQKIQRTDMMAAPIAPYFFKTGGLPLQALLAPDFKIGKLPKRQAPWVEAGIGGADGGLLEKKDIDFRLLQHVPIGPDFPVWAGAFIEPVLALLKAKSLGDLIHEALLERAGGELTHPKVAVAGATGGAGLAIVGIYRSLGIETWVIGRRPHDDPKVLRLVAMGAKYVHLALSPAQEMESACWERYLPFLAEQMGVLQEGQVGGLRQLFDLSGNPFWVDQLGLLCGASGGIVDFAIPAGAHFAGSSYDGAGIIRQRTVNNTYRVGSVNLCATVDLKEAVRVVQWLVANHEPILRQSVRIIDGLDVADLSDALCDVKNAKPLVFPQGKAAVGWQA
ncbi:MAG: hypothetical protein HY735_37260 [Verrucomicrobia bacterium]|nr:hypothetical protein [Verrucomicrobiota bacterium]